MYKIKDFSNQLGVKSDTIRYYEKIGLTKKPDRSLNGYRTYSQQDLYIFKFIMRCKEFGFSLKEIKPILNYILNTSKNTSKIEKLLEEKILEIEIKQRELRKLKKQLKTVLESCIKEDCTILDYL
ncbi:MAG: hypothetical protein BM556_08090 [Bacteriovorax sp. MedPE-SWde]|nr:MAG: hypothetical protein BM556_08090 [Bacteriovorax sp. MedPE-SWde]